MAWSALQPSRLEKLLALDVPFVGHRLTAALFCLWQAGLPAPKALWDVFIFEKLTRLGRHHPRYTHRGTSDDAAAAKAREESEGIINSECALAPTAWRSGVACGLSSDFSAAVEFWSAAIGQAEEFGFGVIRKAAEEARVAACLYPHQVEQAEAVGILRHAVSVEMPWVITNARMCWNGIRVDKTRWQAVSSKIAARKERLEHELARQGLYNVNSHPQLTAFFTRQGLLHHFKSGDGHCFDKEQLKINDHLHPAVSKVAELKRIETLQTEPIVASTLDGRDGRVHPLHTQLGAHTGRQTCKWPNILGLDSRLRVVVTPAEGCGIGEADWCQIEVGVAAAVYGDEVLIAMFNTGDVYSAMAQKFYSARLGPEARDLPALEFKARYPEEREVMKTCTLGMLYGITAWGIARRLRVTEARARQVQDEFARMFPRLHEGRRDAALMGVLNGFATALNNVRRYRGCKGPVNSWEKNWFTNHPVQGSAAVIFKHAGNRLDRLYQGYGARIIVPLHDSFVFEAPLDRLEEVARLTAAVMTSSVTEFYPKLQPKVEVNIFDPSCWNKDGNAKALEEWVAGWNCVE
jgi:DNA polymerase-1